MVELLVLGTLVLSFLTFVIALLFFAEARQSRQFLLFNVLFLLAFFFLFAFHFFRVLEHEILASYSELALTFFLFLFSAVNYQLTRRAG